MDNLFMVLALLSIIGLIVGLINPNIFEKIFKIRTNRKTISLVFGIAIVVFFILVGVTASPTPKTSNQSQNQTATQAQTTSTKKYEKLTLNAQRNGENIKVEGETDLPNESKLTIQIERPLMLKGETEKRYAKVGWNNPIVKDGKYSASIKIDDTKVESNTPESVDSNIRITVSFHPNWYGEKIQTDEILKLVGTKGENLTGEEVKVIGSATNNPYNIFEIITTIEFSYNGK